MNGKGRQNGKYFYINEIISLVCFFFAHCLLAAYLCVSVRVNEHVLVLGCLSSASFPFLYEYFATITFTLVFSLRL